MRRLQNTLGENVVGLDIAGAGPLEEALRTEASDCHLLGFWMATSAKTGINYANGASGCCAKSDSGKWRL